MKFGQWYPWGGRDSVYVGFLKDPVPPEAVVQVVINMGIHGPYVVEPVLAEAIEWNGKVACYRVRSEDGEYGPKDNTYGCRPMRLEKTWEPDKGYHYVKVYKGGYLSIQEKVGIDVVLGNLAKEDFQEEVDRHFDEMVMNYHAKYGGPDWVFETPGNIEEKNGQEEAVIPPQ